VTSKRFDRKKSVRQVGKNSSGAGGKPVWSPPQTGLVLLGVSAVIMSLTLAGVNADKIFDLANWAVHAVIAWALYGKGGSRRDQS